MDESLQCSVLGGINFVNVTFKNIDFTGSKTIFENCKFNNIIFRKAEFWSCTFRDCQVKESNLTRAEFNSSIFRNCEFLNSNLKLILAWDVRLWESNKYMEIKDSSNFANILKDMNLISTDEMENS